MVKTSINTVLTVGATLPFQKSNVVNMSGLDLGLNLAEKELYKIISFYKILLILKSELTSLINGSEKMNIINV
jgi:hypothetical protein